MQKHEVAVAPPSGAGKRLTAKQHATILTKRPLAEKHGVVVIIAAVFHLDDVCVAGRLQGASRTAIAARDERIGAHGLVRSPHAL